MERLYSTSFDYTCIISRDMLADCVLNRADYNLRTFYFWADCNHDTSSNSFFSIDNCFPYVLWSCIICWRRYSFSRSNSSCIALFIYLWVHYVYCNFWWNHIDSLVSFDYYSLMHWIIIILSLNRGFGFWFLIIQIMQSLLIYIKF